jgi:Fe-S cluster assembly protein SufD
MARFQEVGFPVARRGNEEWKYTDVGPLARLPFAAPVMSPAPELSAEEAEEMVAGRPQWIRLAFVNGRYVKMPAPSLPVPKGVRAGRLGAGIAEEPALMQAHLSRLAPYEKDAFTALNTAFLHEGSFVHIQDRTVLQTPIHLLHRFTQQGAGAAFFPRALIVVGRASKATLIEDFEGASASQCFADAVTEVVVGPGADLRYYRIQRQGPGAFHIATTQVEQAQDSTFSCFTLDLGGGLVRNTLQVHLAGEASACTLNGLYMLNGSQHVDNQVLIDHAVPRTSSRELYKGVLDGRSHAVFHGSITVRRGAQKAEAHQSDKNLLLSDDAEVDTKPAFWIYADDVKCAHGAACGKMDENALFYLRSRGLDEKAARELLVHGFASEVVNTIPDEPLRLRVEELVSAKLGGL